MKKNVIYILFLRLFAFFLLKLSRGRLNSQDFGLEGISGLAIILLFDLQIKYNNFWLFF